MKCTQKFIFIIWFFVAFISNSVASTQSTLYLSRYIDITINSGSILNYSEADIFAQGHLKINTYSGNGEIFINATGDINIAGIFDFGNNTVYINTPGNVNLSGEFYGSGILNINSGQTLSLTDNRNGDPDEFFSNAGIISVFPDSEWGVIPSSSSSATLSDSSVILTSYPVVQTIPLPAAVWMFLSAVSFLFFSGRTKSSRA